MDVSCHRPFLPGTPLEPVVIPTAQASSFTLQYFITTTTSTFFAACKLTGCDLTYLSNCRQKQTLVASHSAGRGFLVLFKSCDYNNNSFFTIYDQPNFTSAHKMQQMK